MSVERFVQAAYAYLFIGDYNQAKAAFERAVEADPENPEPYFYASITAHRSGHVDEAYDLVRKALSLRPQCAQYREHLAAVRASQHLERGKLAYVHGEIDLAYDCFASAVSIDPLHQEARMQLEEFIRLHPNYHRLLKEDPHDTRYPSPCCHCRCDGTNGT